METVCEHCGKTTTIRKQKKIKDTEKAKDSKEVIQFYADTFKSKFNTEPEINWAACTIATNRLLKTRTKVALKNLVVDYIDTDEPFFKQAGLRYLLFPTWLQARVVNEVKTTLCNVNSYNKKSSTQWDGLL